jgi:hypothetical protein
LSFNYGGDLEKNENPYREIFIQNLIAELIYTSVMINIDQPLQTKIPSKNDGILTPYSYKVQSKKPDIDRIKKNPS